jgi:hypothetical protein
VLEAALQVEKPIRLICHEGQFNSLMARLVISVAVPDTALQTGWSLPSEAASALLYDSIAALKKSRWSNHGKHGLQRMASSQATCVRLYCFVADFIVFPQLCR